MSRPGCPIEDCGAAPFGHGMCQKHYNRWYRHGTPHLPSDEDRRQKNAERFWSKVDKSGDCWIWNGARKPDNYGMFTEGSSNRMMAHRWSYAHAYGPIPEGALILHSCDNPPCVNPAHLRAGTPAENMRDMVERGRAWNGRGRKPAALEVSR